jgi:hypothetical protein
MSWKIRVSHPGGLIWLALGRWCRRGGEPGLAPGGETADDVAHTFEAEVDQRGGGDNGGAAVVTTQHDLLPQAADVRVAPGAVWVEPPFEHCAWDVERAGDDAFALAVEIGANVDQEGAPFSRHQCFSRFEPLDPCLCRVEQVFESSPVSPNGHGRIICWPPRHVQRLLHLKSAQAAALAHGAGLRECEQLGHGVVR